MVGAAPAAAESPPVLPAPEFGPPADAVAAAKPSSAGGGPPAADAPAADAPAAAEDRVGPMRRVSLAGWRRRVPSAQADEWRRAALAATRAYPNILWCSAICVL